MTFIIRRLRSVLAAAGIVVASVGMATMTPTAAHADQVNIHPHYQHGCPPFAVCIYKAGGGWQDNKPSRYFYPQTDSHQWHNLVNMYGTHRILNNGLDFENGSVIHTEAVSINTGYNGGGKHYWISAGKFVDVRNMTPWNSVTLWHNWEQLTWPAS